MSSWISVKERPKERCGILVTDGHCVTVCELTWSHQGTVPRAVMHGHGFGGYEWEFDFDWKDVTHWMPLPDPPREESHRAEQRCSLCQGTGIMPGYHDVSDLYEKPQSNEADHPDPEKEQG